MVFSSRARRSQSGLSSLEGKQASKAFLHSSLRQGISHSSFSPYYDIFMNTTMPTNSTHANFMTRLAYSTSIISSNFQIYPSPDVVGTLSPTGTDFKMFFLDDNCNIVLSQPRRLNLCLIPCRCSLTSPPKSAKPAPMTALESA